MRSLPVQTAIYNYLQTASTWPRGSGQIVDMALRSKVVDARKRRIEDTPDVATKRVRACSF